MVSLFYTFTEYYYEYLLYLGIHELFLLRNSPNLRTCSVYRKGNQVMERHHGITDCTSVDSDSTNVYRFDLQKLCQSSKSHFLHVLFSRTLNLYESRTYMEKVEIVW